MALWIFFLVIILFVYKLEKKNTLEEAPQQSNVTTVTEDDNKDEEMASAGPPKKKWTSSFSCIGSVVTPINGYIFKVLQKNSFYRVLSKPATRQEVESPSDDEASHEEEDDTEEDDVSLDDDDEDDDDDDDEDSEDDDDKDSDDDDNDSDDDDVDEGNDEKDKSGKIYAINLCQFKNIFIHTVVKTWSSVTRSSVAQKKTVRKDLPSDVKEGRTLFIRCVILLNTDLLLIKVGKAQLCILVVM